MHGATDRNRLVDWYGQLVAALDPRRRTAELMGGAEPPAANPVILAIGKAAATMAAGAIDGLARHGREPVAGVVVPEAAGPVPHPALSLVPGDHPVPGAASRRAADAISACLAAHPAPIPVEVLLSGGATSLVAAPVDGLTADDLERAFATLHASGLAIGEMNALRRRLTRFGGGRLGALLVGRAARAWIVSDVAGNDLAAIGSGPLVADDRTPEDLLALADRHLSPGTTGGSLRRVMGSPLPRPPAIPHTIVLDREALLDTMARIAEADGFLPVVHRESLLGDAVEAGRDVVSLLWRRSRARTLKEMHAAGVQPMMEPATTVAHLWHAEPTVTLPRGAGIGGRAQHLALAAAEALAELGWQGCGPLLAAGTDGRDGPTEAAGAVIDGASWATIAAAGMDPALALRRADSHTALAAIGATLPRQATGTNLNDVVIALGAE